MNIKQAISNIPQVILAIRKKRGEVSHEESEYLALTATAFAFFFESYDGDSIVFRGEVFDLSLIDADNVCGAYHWLDSQNVKGLIDHNNKNEVIEYTTFSLLVRDITKFVRITNRYLYLK